MRIGPLRPSWFIEERRWPPLEFLKNRCKAQPHPFLNIPTQGSNQSLFNSHHSIRDFNSFKPTFELPFRLQLNKEKKLKGMPDLQLGLSQRVGIEENKPAHYTSTKEISTKLSLS